MIKILIITLLYSAACLTCWTNHTRFTNWPTNRLGKFETAFQPLYCQSNGRPGKPIRLMCGMLILKHLRNLSDESLVEQWSENAYYQYFCGMQEFTPSVPCASSELVHFRKRIGKEGIELIFQESIRVNNEDDEDRHHDTAFIDSTVQERISLIPRMQSCIRRSWRKFLVLWKSWGFLCVKATPLCWRESIVTSVSGTIPRTGRKPSRQTGVYVL